MNEAIETFPAEAFVVLGVAFFAWIASLGLSLKMAFKVVGADPPGYFGCLGYALMIPIVNGLIGSVALATIGHAFGLVAIFQIYVQIKILATAGNCGGWRAFFTGIVHGIFFGLITVVILLAVVFSGTIDTDAMKGPLQEMAEKAMEHHQSSEAAAGGGGSVMPWSTSKTEDGATVNPFFQE